MSDESNNTGNWNSGNWNSGNWNSGNWNSGNWNSGDRNSGNWNSGNWNSGSRNSGDWNSGNRNSGSRNSGDWNSGDWNAGFFNSNTPDVIRVFNKDCDRTIWDNAEKPDWIYNPSPTTWVSEADMSDQEKVDNPDFHVRDGYLRRNDMAEEWRKAYSEATEEDIQKTRDLPNFDAVVFEEITGIDLSIEKPKDCTGKIVEIDGVKYRLERE